MTATRAADLTPGNLIDYRLPTGETLIAKVDAKKDLPYLEEPMVELTLRDVTPESIGGSRSVVPETRLVGASTTFTVLHA